MRLAERGLVNTHVGHFIRETLLALPAQAFARRLRDRPVLVKRAETTAVGAAGARLSWRKEFGLDSATLGQHR